MIRFAPALLALLLATAGCASVSVEPGPASPQQASAAQLAEEGRHAEAATAWAGIAAGARGGARDRAWLQAAEQYRLADDIEGLRRALSQSSRRRLDGSDLARHDLLAAQLHLQAGDAPRALSLLSQPRESVPAPLRPRWHALRAQALEAQQRGFEAAAELAWLDARLERRERLENARAIERLLAAQSDAALSAGAAALPPGHPLYAFAGRALTQRGLPLPRPYDRGASAPGLAALPPADPDGYRPPQRLAVLLPLSGPLAAAGASVRDGVLAAYYGETRRRPELRFYDTGAADGVQAAVSQAQADGAQMLLGPLTREEVNAVFGAPDLVVPAVALNRGTAPPPPGSASFALSPEDEGIAAADRLSERGLRRVLVVTQADDNAQRALAAFRERLAARGGSVIGEVVVDEADPDYVPALQQAVAQGGGRPEALFLSLKAAQARLLSSQVDAAGLIGVPRVATSLILSGANLRMDVELDGIEYPELPWLLGLRGGLPDPDTIGRTLPSAQGGGARLFAFGMDALGLSAHLDQLVTDPGASLRGATGELQLDGLGVVSRKPAWAVFSGGRARPAPDGALLPDAGAP